MQYRSWFFRFRTFGRDPPRPRGRGIYGAHPDPSPRCSAAAIFVALPRPGPVRQPPLHCPWHKCSAAARRCRARRVGQALQLFTPTEAAVLTGLPLKTVNNAIDKKTVSAIAARMPAGQLDCSMPAPSFRCPSSADFPTALHRNCGERCLTRWRNPRAMSCRLKVGCSRSICTNLGASWRRPCENCAGRDALSSATRRSWAAIRPAAAPACRCT